MRAKWLYKPRTEALESTRKSWLGQKGRLYYPANGADPGDGEIVASKNREVNVTLHGTQIVSK